MRSLVFPQSIAIVGASPRNVKSVQHGLDSAIVSQGRLMWESERLLAEFPQRVHDALIGQPRRRIQAPPVGRIAEA